MRRSRLATIIVYTCGMLVGACRSKGDDTQVCERYAEFDGPPLEPMWCAKWLGGWDTHTYKKSRQCLSRAENRLEMRQCEFEDEEGATDYPFARRECALAATTMAEFEACAETAPIETEKTFEPIGPPAAAVEPATVLGLVHRDTTWHALLLQPSLYARSYDDEAALALVPVSSEGLGGTVWRLAPAGLNPYKGDGQNKFLVGGEFFAYVTKDGQLRSIRLGEQAEPEVMLELGTKRRMVAHSLLPGPTGPRGVVVTQPLGPPREIRGGGRADEKRGPVENWLPQFVLEPLGGEARVLVEYTEAEISGDVKFAASAVNGPGAHLAVAWTGPYRAKERPFHVVLFDDESNQTFRTEVEGFEVMWLASTSDGITTIIASKKFMSERDMTVFRFSVDGEVGERRRLNWPQPTYSIPIACGKRLALVRVGGSELRGGKYGYADYWDVSGRENLDLPERIWWGTQLASIDVAAGCDGEQPGVAWISPRVSKTNPGVLDSRGPLDFMFMTVP